MGAGDSEYRCFIGKPVGYLADEVGDGGLAFRVLSPVVYRDIANMLDAKRIERPATYPAFFSRCCKCASAYREPRFVTRGKSVSIHRCSCKTFRGLLEHAPERVIQTAWTDSAIDAPTNSEQKKVFPADLVVAGVDRPELMRGLFEVLTRQGVHVADLRKSAKKGLGPDPANY